MSSVLHKLRCHWMVNRSDVKLLEICYDEWKQVVIFPCARSSQKYSLQLFLFSIGDHRAIDGYTEVTKKPGRVYTLVNLYISEKILGRQMKP